MPFAPMPAHLAARVVERLRAEREAEAARQLALHLDGPPPGWDGEPADPSDRAPEWAVNY